MASTDAKAIPVKAAAYRVTAPIWDADGDLVTGASSLDSEVSKDGGAFADCTNEATEIGSSGIYTLDLTSTEMDADTVVVQIKTATAGAKTTPIVLYTAARSVNDLAYPTTSGRSIDVTAGGEVGIDWANIGSPTTVVGLSGTTVKTATDVETDTADIQSRLPAALTAGGNIKADALALSGDTTAADNAEAFFDGTGYAGTNNVIPTVTSVTNGVTLATGAVSAAAVATGAIDADAIAADAVAEIADGVWDEAASGHTTAGTFGQYLQVTRQATAQAGGATSITLDASASATDDLYNGQVVTVIGGTGAGQARVITDYNGTTKAATVDSAWATNPSSDSVFLILPTGLGTYVNVAGSVTGAVGSVTGNVGGNVSGSVGSVASGGITATSIAADAIGASELAADAVAEIADGVWDEARSGHTTSGTFGEGVVVNSIAASAITAASIAADAITAAKIADGAIDANTFAAGAITAAAIATGAVDADALASDAVTEIWAKTVSEPSGMFAWTTGTVLEVMQVIGALVRNEINSDSNSVDVRNDADNANLWSYATSDDGSTFVAGEGA